MSDAPGPPSTSPTSRRGRLAFAGGAVATLLLGTAAAGLLLPADGADEEDAAAALPDCPTAEGTGVRDESRLTPSEDVDSEHDGQIIEDLEVTGSIEVRHRDVTVRNVRVYGTSYYGIHIPSGLDGGADGLVIEDAEIIGRSGGRAAGIPHYGAWTARRVEIRGFEDGVKMGSDQTLEDSWIHDLHRPEGAHSDGVQVGSGQGSVIRGNTIEGPYRAPTSAILLQTNSGPVDDWLVEGNCLSGGGYTLYVEDKDEGYGPPTDVRVVDNLWVADSWRYGATRIDEGDGWRFTGNVDDAGEPLT